MGEKLTLSEFSTLVGRFYPDLTKRAFNLCKDYAMAEDVVQNALLLAFEKFEKFEKLDYKAYDIQFRAWLYKMLSNMVHDMFSRGNGVAKPHQQKYAYASFVHHIDKRTSYCTDVVSESFGYRNSDSEIDYIMKAINELPTDLRYREIAKMAFVDELTSIEIGNILGLADGTIRPRILRIRQILREKLAPVICG